MERRWDDGGWPWVSIIILTQIPTQSGAQYQTKWEQQKQTTQESSAVMAEDHSKCAHKTCTIQAHLYAIFPCSLDVEIY